MLNFHNTLPPQPDTVSFDETAAHMKSPREAARLGKFTAAALIVNGATTEVADDCVHSLMADQSFPYANGSTEELFFHRAASYVILHRNAEAERLAV